MDVEVPESFLRQILVQQVAQGNLLNLPKERRGTGKITRLEEQTVILNVNSVPVKRGKLEATVELIEIDGEQHPHAYVNFGGSYSIMLPLSARKHKMQYGEIISALRDGSYKLELNAQGELNLILDNE